MKSRNIIFLLSGEKIIEKLRQEEITASYWLIVIKKDFLI